MMSKKGLPGAYKYGSPFLNPEKGQSLKAKFKNYPRF